MHFRTCILRRGVVPFARYGRRFVLYGFGFTKDLVSNFHIRKPGQPSLSGLSASKYTVFF